MARPPTSGDRAPGPARASGITSSSFDGDDDDDDENLAREATREVSRRVARERTTGRRARERDERRREETDRSGRSFEFHVVMADQPTYSFPILSNSEILACLRELEVPLTETQLLRPTHDGLRSCYETLFEIFSGQTVAELGVVDEEVAAETLDYPELYAEAIPNLAFFRSMQQLLDGVGVDDFCLKDIFKPEYGRTRRNLSALINFAKFREEKLIEYEDALAARDEEQRAYDAALELNARLKAEIAAAEKRDNAEDAEALEREVEELQREVDAATLEADEAERKVLEAEKEVEEMKIAEQELDKQIAEFERNKATKAGEEQELAEAQARKAKELEQNVEELQQFEKELKESIEVMENIRKTREEHEAQKLKLKEINDEIAAKEEETWKLDAKMEQLQRQNQAMDEKMARMESQGKLKLEAAEAALKTAQEELAEAEARADQQKAKDLADQKEAAELEAAIKKLTEEHNQDMDALMRKYEELRDTVVEYHNELFEAMEECNAKGLKREKAVAMESSPGGSSMMSTPPSAISLDRY
jgi:kinetochore protein Nuf2